MTAPSRTLSRLTMLTVAAATGAVLVAPVLPAAAAVYPPTGLNVSNVAITPAQDSANTGVCNPYTVALTASPGSGSVTVEITQQATSTGTETMTIGFCEPLAAEDSPPVAAQPSPTTTGASSSGTACTTAAAAQAGASLSEGCETQYADTNGDGEIVIGVTSDHAGAMTVHPYADKNGDGIQQSAEPGASAQKTWLTNNVDATSNTISCAPASAANPTGTEHTFTCTVKDTNNQPVPDATVAAQVASGPDNGMKPSCGTTGDGESGSTEPGTVDCSYTNNGGVGHDVIDVWVDIHNPTPNGTQEPSEPHTQITKDWLAPAPNGSNLTLSCSPNQTTSSGDNPTCQEPTSQGTVTITATVTNGTPAQPVPNVIVQFDQPSDTSPSGKSDSDDTESVSPDQCTTTSNGTCTTTFTDTKPRDGEKFSVVAHLARQGQAADTATATIVYHDPTAADARNISVTPDSASAAAGTVEEFTAEVVDRFGNKVPGVSVSWVESGPGTFRSGASTTSCTTGAQGTCTVETTSLDAERGEQTVTGTIAPSNYPSTTHNECSAPADKTYVDPASSSSPGDAPGAPAGNCSDDGSVTWTDQPPPSEKEHPSLTCFSPRKHVLKCKVVSRPLLVGAQVTFRKVHKDGSRGAVLAQKVTNDNGVAKLKRTGLTRHKVWRVIAKVHGQGNVQGGWSNKDRTRIR